MWYALHTSLSLEQEPHHWQEKSMGFQGAIFRRNVCIKLIICLMYFLSICLCPRFENTALNVGLYVALLMCAADLWACNEGLPAPALLADLFRRWGRQRKGTRPCKWSWFIPALLQWGSFAGTGGMTQLERSKAGRRVSVAPCTQWSQPWRGAVWEGAGGCTWAILAYRQHLWLWWTGNKRMCWAWINQESKATCLPFPPMLESL